MEREKSRIESVGKWFSTYDGFNSKIIHYTAKYLINLCKGPTVLEMGCGDGLITHHLSERFDKIVAVEGSKRLIDKAKTKFIGRNIEFINSMFESLNLDMKFNTVWQSHILEHVKNPVEVLSKGRDHLENDGILIAEVPNANSIHRLLGVKMGIISSITSLSEMDNKLGHRRVYTLQSLKKDAEAAGLKVIKAGGFFLKPLSNDQMETMSDDLVDAFFELGKDIPEYAAEIYIVCKKI